jgi:hypothetical protein
MKGSGRLLALTMLGVVVALVVVFLGGEPTPSESPTTFTSARQRAPTAVANPSRPVPTTAAQTSGDDTSGRDVPAGELNDAAASLPPPVPSPPASANGDGDVPASLRAATGAPEAGVPEAASSTSDDDSGFPLLWCFRARSGFTWQEPDDRAAPQHSLVSDGNVVASGSASARIGAADATLPGSAVGVMWQAIAGTPFRGKRVEVSAHMRSRIVQTGHLFVRTQSKDVLALWVSDQGAPGARGLNQYLPRDADWARLAVVHDVPADADVLYYGVALFGGGHVWIDDVTVAVVDASAPLTHHGSVAGIPNIPIDPRWILPTPANLDLELTSADPALRVCTNEGAN